MPRPTGSSQDAKERKMSVYVGIDWSVKKHDVVIINESGKSTGFDFLLFEEAGVTKSSAKK